MIVRRIRFYSDRDVERTPLSKVKNPTFGAQGTYFGRRAAHKADEEGASDEEILRRAKKASTISGAIEGSIVGTVLGKEVKDSLSNKRNLVKLQKLADEKLKKEGLNKFAKKVIRNKNVGTAAGIGAGLATAGTMVGLNRLASHKNTKARLKKRNEMDFKK
nr:MAG TPA: hypothetical protein [Bacteriophage sp.]